jgi:hypothetical protein
MALAASAITYESQGPTKSGQVLAERGLSGGTARILYGTATLTGDGAATTSAINWIDGIQTLPFVPSGVLVFSVGGTAASTISCVSASAITNLGFTLTVSAAPANTLTLFVAIVIFK